MIVYLHGFASGPSSFKARLFCERLGQLGIGLEVPDLNQGDFEHLTLSGQLRLLGEVCAREGRDPLVLIGSSMGGYLAALYAAQHPVAALVLMAPAVDFYRRWVERLGPEPLAQWREQGHTEVEHHALRLKARLSYDLMVDAARHEPWPVVSAPVLVLHGTRDEVVPQARVERWVAMTPSARLVLYDAGHELIECAEDMVVQARRFLGSVQQVAAAYPMLAGPASPPAADLPG